MSGEVEKSENYKGHIIKIYIDEDPDNPRECYDNFGKMVCFHRRYSIGDKHDFKTPEDFEAFVKSEKGIAVLPIYAYIHSGITIKTGSFSDPWDSGQIGWIYATAQTIRETYMVKRITKKIRAKAIELLDLEVKQYDNYLTMPSYYFVVEDEDGEEVERFYGFEDVDDCLDEARKIVDHATEDLFSELPTEHQGKMTGGKA
jgi:hypothetical protein